MLIEATPGRFRLKLWMAALLPILAAVPILAWAGIDPFRRDPAALAIEEQEVWAALGVDSEREVLITSQGRPNPIEHPLGAPNCLVKLVRVVRVSPSFHGEQPSYHFSRASICQDGTRRNEVSRPMSVEASRSEVASPSLTRTRKVVAALPPADRWVGPESAILVGSLQGFHWEVRAYDRQHLPAEVAELVALTGLK